MTIKKYKHILSVPDYQKVFMTTVWAAKRVKKYIKRNIQNTYFNFNYRKNLMNKI